jgi:uncharacterized membrane protein YkvA (DUF1232 family)
MRSPFFGGKTPKTFRFLRFIYHLPNFIKLTWRLFWDSRVPIHRKAIFVVFVMLAVVLSVAYFHLPFDAIPDFLPIGRGDDLLVGIFLILVPGAWLFIKLAPEDIVLEHVDRISKRH